MRRFFPALPFLALATLAAPLTLLHHDHAAGGHHAATRVAAVPVAAAVQPGVRRHDRDSDPHSWQTSDRVIGPRTSHGETFGRATTQRTRRFNRWLAPGVKVASWQEHIGTRSVRYFVLKANWTRKGVQVSYLHPPRVAQDQTLTTMVAPHRHAVAAVNGDFFDIGDTGAPLGLGVDRRVGMRHARSEGWNSSFYFGKKGVPHIGQLPMSASIAEHPRFKVTNVDSAQVMPFGIGIFTPRWGRTAGYRWTDGQVKNVRMVHVYGGRVVSTVHVFHKGHAFKGRILVARGKKQREQLDRLHVGDPIHLHWHVDGSPRTALSGPQIVLHNGKITATDNSELHPRTAVGIDPDHKRIILLVVEGRQEFSDGYTLVEEARKLRSLGATQGLNLDGGGSSEMVGRLNGRIQVVNSPSDGSQRQVANGLVVTSTAR